MQSTPRAKPLRSLYVNIRDNKVGGADISTHKAATRTACCAYNIGYSNTLIKWAA